MVNVNTFAIGRVTPAATPRPKQPARGPLAAELLRRLAGQVVLAPGERAAIDVIAPFTGQPLGWIPRCTAADVHEAARRARAAQAGWARTPFAERKRILLRFHDLLLERQEEGLDIVQLECGKARMHAFEELADTAVVARHYAFRAERYLRPRWRRGLFPGMTLVREYHHPVGVVGYIVPWNYPLNLSITDALPALMAGNAVVLKPDHQTSFTALWAVDLLYRAGLPKDLLCAVTGYGPELGTPLLDDVDFVMFTGSGRTGRIIARQAVERLIGYSLELGGKNPMIVLEDADLDAAADGAARGCFVGAGQVCVSIERIYVHASVFDSFVERFAERARALRLGAELAYGPEMGSLASASQLDTVMEHVRDALHKGASLVTGGRPRPDLGPYFYEPTILTGVREGMKAFAEETFGPVVSVYPFESEEEAIRMANETAYGLNASVWSGSLRRGRQVAKRIEAGSVNVNEAYAAAWGSVDAPIGGFKESGMGRRHGREGILKYTEPQTVAAQWGMAIAPPPLLGQQGFARFISGFLKVARRVPGLR
jgi:succinate-semialdehyde dehydrogenase / glutarate-semialdehyde dehydrogenase